MSRGKTIAEGAISIAVHRRSQIKEENDYEDHHEYEDGLSTLFCVPAALCGLPECSTGERAQRGSFETLALATILAAITRRYSAIGSVRFRVTASAITCQLARVCGHDPLPPGRYACESGICRRIRITEPGGADQPYVSPSDQSQLSDSCNCSGVLTEHHRRPRGIPRFPRDLS